MALGAHHRQHRAGQRVPAEKVRLKDSAQRVRWQVFDGAGNGIGPVVKKRVQLPARGRQNLIDGVLEGGPVLVIKKRGDKAFGLQSRAVFWFATRGKDTPAARFERLGRVISDAA